MISQTAVNIMQFYSERIKSYFLKINHSTLALPIILRLAAPISHELYVAIPNPDLYVINFRKEGKTLYAVIKTKVYIDLFKFLKIRCFYISVFTKLGIPPLRLVLLPPPENDAW
jgi:hypothetical protein